MVLGYQTERMHSARIIRFCGDCGLTSKCDAIHIRSHMLSIRNLIKRFTTLLVNESLNRG